MHKYDFIDKVIGLPWKNREISFNAVDCWGLVVLYFLHVNNKKIPVSISYTNGETFTKCYNDEVIHWRSVSRPTDGAIAVFKTNGKPVHVGVVIDKSKILHSSQKAGLVKVDSIDAVTRFFDCVEFLEYADC